MHTLILLGTLKREGLSNTQTLCEFLMDRMIKKNIGCELVKLVEYTILPGTYTDMGGDDEWPEIYQKILAADILILATPIWWSGHSSEVQRVIERLDEIHDEILEGKESRLAKKVGGLVITGDSDGAQHVIGNIANFFNALGLVLPPYGTLSVLSDKQRKDSKTSRDALMTLYETDYAHYADTMVEQLLTYAQKY